MADIIDLCSSDEEEVKVVQSKAAIRRRRSKPVTPEERKQPDDHSSSSSEDRSRRHKPKKPRSLAFGSPKGSWADDSSSDEELAPLGFTVKSKSSKIFKTTNKAPAKENLKPAISQKQPPPSPKTPEQPPPSPETPKRPTVYNPYASKRPATSSSSTQPVTYPNPNSQKYEDLRAKYIFAFWKYAQTLVHASYNLVKLDQFCRRINALVFSTFPIRSLEEYCQRFTHTTDVASISEALEKGQVNRQPSQLPNDGKYVSIAEACLVAMLDHVESIADDPSFLPSVLSQKIYWVALADLLPMINARLKDACPGKFHQSADHYLEPSTRSAEFKQLEKLQTKAQGQDLSWIKPHRQNKQVYYELTTVGHQMAFNMRERTFPSPNGHFRSSNLVQEEYQGIRSSNLETVQEKYQGIMLAVDSREGGGAKKQLHSMCNKLDSLKIPYFVRKLDIGDYCFFTMDNQLYPVLVERKSIQDVAASIHDGRWINQKRRMYQGQYVFGYDNCRMAYIIEGDKKSQELTGGYVGERRFDVTRQQLDEQLESLEEEGFEVIRTLSRDHSMVELARWATGIRRDFLVGKLKPQYTYEEFLRKVAKIPRKTDFSRIAKDHAASSKQSNDFEVKKQSTTAAAAGVAKKPAAQRKLVFGQSTASKKHNYDGLKVKELQAKCEEFGLTKTGKKSDLIARLNGPRPPKLLLERKKRDVGYCPSKHNTCATAILVGLWLEQRKEEPDWKGLTKEELYPLAESLDISKEPFSGTVTGPFKYDGWSSMSELRGGEIPLVVLKKGRFRLTTSSDVAGLPLAEAMHGWCHEHSICRCQEEGYVYGG